MSRKLLLFGFEELPTILAAAGGTPLFQQRRLASQQAAETQGLFRAPAVLGGDIATVPGHHPVSPPLRRRTGCGQTPQLLRTDGDQDVPLRQIRDPGLELGDPVVPTAGPQQTGRD